MLHGFRTGSRGQRNFERREGDEAQAIEEGMLDLLVYSLIEKRLLWGPEHIQSSGSYLGGSNVNRGSNSNGSRKTLWGPMIERFKSKDLSHIRKRCMNSGTMSLWMGGSLQAPEPSGSTLACCSYD